MEINRIGLNPSSVARFLAAAAALLILLSIGGQLLANLTEHPRAERVAQLLYIGAECNLPTGYSTFLLLFAAQLLFVLTVLERKKGSSFSLYWTVLSFGFLCMAVDEALAIHERLSPPFRWLLGGEDLGIFYYAWVIPASALVLFLGLFFWRFVWRLPRKTRRVFLGAAIIYLSGAIGAELIEGYLIELHGRRTLGFWIAISIEESLEMAGIILFIWALLVYFGDKYQSVEFDVEKE